MTQFSTESSRQSLEFMKHIIEVDGLIILGAVFGTISWEFGGAIASAIVLAVRLGSVWRDRDFACDKY